MREEYPYNPFGKNLREVSAVDLNVLKNTSEGWYIEYKRAPQDVRGTAKTLSAFANQYGGMLFVGVTEASDGSRVAGEFNGIPAADIPRISLLIREASSANISPPVFYEEQVIKGPCDPIGLPVDHAIVVIGVPQGLDAPYIHASGRIYRRVADQSAPKEETDRHILDRLWERGRKFRDQVAKRLRNSPELPEAQANSAVAVIHLVPDLRLSSPEKVLEFEKFRELANAKNEVLSAPNLPLDTVYSRNGGYTGRQVSKNNPTYATVAFHWWHDGVARIEMPLNTFRFGDFGVSGYAHTGSFMRELGLQKYTAADVCDFSMLALGIMALTNLHSHLREATGDNRPLYATFELRNVLYKVPFVNSEKYIARCRKYGVPVITDRTIHFHEEPYFDNMILLEPDEDATAETKRLLLPVVLIAAILGSVGITPDDAAFAGDPDLWRNHHAERNKSE